MCVQSSAIFSMGGEQHSCHGNGSRINGPADLGLRPEASLLGRAGASRDTAQGRDHVHQLGTQSQRRRAGPAATRARPSLRVCPQSTHGGTATPTSLLATDIRENMLALEHPGLG